jgi:hypothetical protein
MSADTTSRNLARAVRALVVIIALASLGWFGIVAWGAFGFARHVLHFPLPLCFAYFLALDACSFAVIIITAIMRDADRAIRRYIWFTMWVFLAGQVISFEGFAIWRGMSAGVRLWSLTPPIFLAILIHLLIIVFRFLDRRRTDDAVRQAVDFQRSVDALLFVCWRAARDRKDRAWMDAVDDATANSLELAAIEHRREMDRVVRDHQAARDVLIADHRRQLETAISQRETAVAEAVAAERARHIDPPPPRPARRQRPASGNTRTGSEDPGKADAVRRIVDLGESPADVAADVGRNVRTLQLWAAAERERRASRNGHAQPAPTLTSA